jgi:putative toxin-antitoxin system antitoxin component (TIGR02293 family)
MQAETTLDKQKLDRELRLLIRRSGIDKKHLPSIAEITYDGFLTDKMLMIMVIRHGVPYSLFNLISEQTPFSENDWADILEISTKSLQRYKVSLKKFKPIQSEKIIEMAEVTNMGMEVFGNMEKFRLWLETPSYALGTMKPVELLRDSYGKEMVMGELTRINYGILA